MPLSLTTADIEELLAALEARSIAAERGLPQNWLSDGVTQARMPPRSDDHPVTRRIGPALSIEIASPEYILAMKAMSTRLSAGDLEDAARLCRLLGFTREDEIEAVIRRYFGDDPAIFGAQELWFERIIDAASVPPE